MMTTNKHCRLAFLASLLALSFGGVQAQDGTGSFPSSQAGAPQSGAAMESGQSSAQDMRRQTSQAESRQATDSSTAGSGRLGVDASGSAAGGNQTAQQGATSQQGPTAAAVYMMVPVEAVAADQAMQRGCWVKLYDAQNFGGESLTLVGPTTVNDMSGPFGINWDDRVESVQTGQRATLTVFDDEEFEDRVAQFKPGQQVPDVSKRMGFFDEFGSVRIDCRQN